MTLQVEGNDDRRPGVDRERAEVLAVLCDVFHPSLSPDAGDDPLLFSTKASDLGVPEAAEQAIALLPRVERGELRRLLRLLDGPIGGLVIGRLRGVASMSVEERERLLRALSVHRIARFRQAFQALKRLSGFLYYSVIDEHGSNRIWPSIGYTPSSRPEPARSNASRREVRYRDDGRLRRLRGRLGAGGGTVAGELTAKGIRTVVLEAGPGDQAPQFTQRELEGIQRLYYQSGLSATRDSSVAILAGACLGGGTTVNWQTCLRTPDYIRDEWAEKSGL